MKATQHQRLTSWLNHRSPEATDTIELWRGGVEDERIDQWPAEACDRAQAFAVMLLDAAQDDAEVWGESCVYQVRHVVDGRPKAQMSFRRDAAGTHGAYAGTANELVAQALAHNEQLMQVFAGTVGQLLRNQERMLDRAYERLEKVEGQLGEAWAMKADAMQISAAAEAVLGEDEARADRSRMLTDKAGKLIDLALTKAQLEAAKKAMEGGS